MTRREDAMARRGFFGVGIFHGKTEANIGTLWRSAHVFGASFIFTIGQRYRPQHSDTTKAWRSVPLFQYLTFEEFQESRPRDCQLIGIELDDAAVPLRGFSHPHRAVYLLGAEDHGLSPDVIAACQRLVVLPGRFCLNVAVAGSIVMHERIRQLDRNAVAA